MLIPFGELCQKFQIKPTGVLHIGASTGQEAAEYYKNGVERTIWIEADPKVFEELASNLRHYNNAKAINACVSYVDGFDVPFYITNNNGESSSIFKMGTHKIVHPDVTVQETIMLKTARVETLLKIHNINIADYDFVNIDIQGAELYALKGMGDLLKQVKYAYIEVNKKPLYEGCAMINEIDDYLQEYGLYRINEDYGGTKWAGDTGWGDALYTKSIIIHSIGGELDALQIQQMQGRQNRKGQSGPVQIINMEEVYTAPKPIPGSLSLAALAEQFDMKITGVINVGAHLGEQVEEYNAMGIVNRALIEPNPITYVKMEERHRIGSLCYNVALSDFEGSQNMNISNGDGGRSNSFLRPTTNFSKQYPKVQFNGGQQQVTVTRLDRMQLDVGLYNMLSLDTNGAELLILTGALETLRFMHYIFTKVYFAELFEGVKQVEKMDEFLSAQGFVRVTTDKSGVTWGNALYARKQFVKMPEIKQRTSQYSDKDVINEFLELDLENDFVQKVPAEFRPKLLVTTPADNHFPFEEWYYKNFSFDNQHSDRIYLPVFWDSYYTNTDAKQKPAYVQELQDFLNTLDKTKKYYTITSYDFGVLNDLEGLDIQVFAMAGNRVDYSIPMVCAPHIYVDDVHVKDIFLSFVGTITDPIRQQMIDYLPKNNPDFYISTKPHTLEEYCKILARSKYVLCPRGRGYTSYRVCEALQYSAIPVYIQDESKWKYGFPEVFELSELHNSINQFEQENGYYYINEVKEVVSYAAQNARHHYATSFTFDAVKKEILENIK